MENKLLDGKTLAKQIRAEIKEKCQDLKRQKGIAGPMVITMLLENTLEAVLKNENKNI